VDDASNQICQIFVPDGQTSLCPLQFTQILRLDVGGWRQDEQHGWPFSGSIRNRPS